MKTKHLLFIVTLLLTVNLTINSQWQQTGPYGGYIYSLAKSGPNIFAGADFYGIFRSTDNGQTWRNNTLFGKEIFALAINGNYIFAGMDSAGVYISTNNGDSWTQTLNYVWVYSLAVNGSDVYAGTNNNGVYHSTNNGQNWIQTSLNNHFVNSLFISGTNIFAGTEASGIYLSTNNGFNWTQTSLNNKSVKAIISDSSIIFAGTTSSGVYLSTNYGINWTQTSLNNVSITSFTVKGSNIFAASNSGIFVSSNYGFNWTQTTLNTQVNALVSDSMSLYAGSGAYSGLNGVLVSTNNGQNWSQSTLSTRLITSLTVCGNYVFGGDYYGLVYVSSNNGLNWYTSQLSESILALATQGANVYAGIQGHYNSNSVFITTNLGQTWAQTNIFYGAYGYSLAVDGQKIYVGTLMHGVYFTTDNGSNWTNIGLPAFEDIAVAANGMYVFACTYDLTGALYRTTNNGVNWVQMPVGSQVFRALAINGTHVYAGGPGVYRSTNNGDNWTQTSLAQSVNSLIIYNNYLIAGTGNSVYFSADDGLTWQQRNEGMENLSVSSLCVLGNFVYASVPLNPIWKRPLSEIIMGRGEYQSNIPQSFYLYQNYPNPFNPTTNIKFSLPHPSQGGAWSIQLVIYDILGRKIADLIPPLRGGHLPAERSQAGEGLSTGTYEVEWNASDYPSGVYLYKLTTENYSETKKLILLK